MNAIPGKRPKVVIINETAARRYWHGENPIGRRILSGLDEDQWSTIIGVVGDVKHARFGRRNRAGNVLSLSADSTGDR